MTSLSTMFVILIVTAGLVLAAGCMGQFMGDKTYLGNSAVDSNLPDFYMAPIGGFEKTDVTLEPNTTFETNYTFYSRNWGPGEVNYSLSAWFTSGSYVNQTYQYFPPFPVDQAQFTIEPSTFIAEPNHSYTSKVSLVSDSLPKEFFTGVHFVGGGWGYSPVNLNIRVRLGDNSTQYADDQVSFKSRFSRPFAFDTLSTDNCSIVMRQGEKKQLNISYLYYPDRGLGKINFTVSQTPLNITFTPSDFIVKHHVEFPVVLTISAGSYLLPGEYPFDILINGNNRPWVVHCRDGDTYPGPPFMNVTIVE